MSSVEKWMGSDQRVVEKWVNNDLYVTEKLMENEPDTYYKCLWVGDCTADCEGCEDYLPPDDDLDELIAKNREQFYSEWNEYLCEWND